MKYMTLSGQQGGPSEYQEPQLCSYKDTREAVDMCNNGSSDFYGQKDELKKNEKMPVCAEFSCSDPFYDNGITALQVVGILRVYELHVTVAHRNI